LSSDSSDNAYILRITRHEVEAQLFRQRWLFVGVRRDWSRGSKILFARRSDAFIASGVVGGIDTLDELDPHERELCIQNNWYAKIAFAKLTRFHPEVPVKDTPFAVLNSVTLHGSPVRMADVVKVETTALCRIHV
jgi:hypothetical protein